MTVPRILDLGAGTGLFSSFVRQKYPEAQLTLMDVSHEMLKGARKRFGDDSNIQYISADFATYSFHGQQYDAVISSLAVHHLSHQVEDQLTWLRNAGFVETDCVYKYNEFAVFFAQKRRTELFV